MEDKTPNCFGCVHTSVCKLWKGLSDDSPKFHDYDKVGANEWLDRLSAVVAERCKHFINKVE